MDGPLRLAELSLKKCSINFWPLDPQLFRQVHGFNIQGSAKRGSPGLVNFVPALAYHFCLSLPAALTLPGARLLAEPGGHLKASFVIKLTNGCITDNTHITYLSEASIDKLSSADRFSMWASLDFFWLVAALSVKGHPSVASFPFRLINGHGQQNKLGEGDGEKWWRRNRRSASGTFLISLHLYSWPNGHGEKDRLFDQWLE